jgi:hypothetical protein
MAADAKKILDHLAALQGRRAPYETDWRDCFDMTFPVRGTGFQGVTNDTARARNAARLDSTGTDAGRTLASGLMGGITPANSRWFGLDVGDETDEERKWLDEAADTVWQNIHAGNFDAAGYECCLDMVSAGWFVLFTDINREQGGGYAFEQWPIAECFISTTRQDGRADTVYRKYTMTAQQAVEHFGKIGGKVSDKLRTKAMDKPFESVELVRVIEPRHLYAVGSKLSKNMPFMSCDVEVDGRHVILEQGYQEFPCAIPRWTMIPGSVYAVGPAFDALPDMLELTELVRMEKAAADLAIAGMWIAEDDGVLNPKTVKVGPRKIIVANSVDSMKELKSGADFNVSFTIKAQLQAQIRRTLMADQLQPQDGPQMTATEVHVRVGLIRQLLGPVYGRLQSEYLQPFVERCFGLAFRAGALGQPPQSLAGRQFHVRYISPLARAQRLEDVVAMDRLETGLITKSQQGKPELMDIYDWEEADRLRAQYLGVPGKLMRSDDDIKVIRDARAEAAQKAEQQQMMQQQVEAQAKNPEQAGVMGALMAA